MWTACASSSAPSASPAASPAPGAAGTRWWGGACGWTADLCPRSSRLFSETPGTLSGYQSGRGSSPTQSGSIFWALSFCQYLSLNRVVWTPEKSMSWHFLRCSYSLQSGSINSVPEIPETGWWRHHYWQEAQINCTNQVSEAGAWWGKLSENDDPQLCDKCLLGRGPSLDSLVRVELGVVHRGCRHRAHLGHRVSAAAAHFYTFWFIVCFKSEISSSVYTPALLLLQHFAHEK